MEQKIYEAKKNEYVQRLEYIDTEIRELNNEEISAVLEMEAFMDLLVNMVSAYKKANYVQKNKFVKILFSNIVVDQQKRLHIVVKP